MTTRIDIPAGEAHVVRVFAVTEKAGAPLSDADVRTALGAGGDLRAAEIELFDLSDLGAMPLSEYLAEGHGIAAQELEGMRGQLDGLSGRVLILPSRAFGGEAMALRIGSALRLVGRFAEDVPPVRFDPLPEGGARGRVARPAADPGKTAPGMRRAAMVLVGLLAAVAVLVIVLVMRA